MIHADPDDLTSQPAGNSGARIACGVIFPPQDGGTPAAGTGTPAAGAGTPAARAGPVATLLPGRDRAGPNDLTVLVRDAACAPVVDAAVTIETWSLEMDHGVPTIEATGAGPGRYAAAGVPMGMAGDWEVAVRIARSGAAPTVVVFVLALDGPRQPAPAMLRIAGDAIDRGAAPRPRRAPRPGASRTTLYPAKVQRLGTTTPNEARPRERLTPVGCLSPPVFPYVAHRQIGRRRT